MWYNDFLKIWKMYISLEQNIIFVHIKKITLEFKGYLLEKKVLVEIT